MQTWQRGASLSFHTRKMHRGCSPETIREACKLTAVLSDGFGGMWQRLWGKALWRRVSAARPGPLSHTCMAYVEVVSVVVEQQQHLGGCCLLFSCGQLCVPGAEELRSVPQQ